MPIISPELLETLRGLLAQTTVSEEHTETPQITALASGIDREHQPDETQELPPNSLFPSVSEEEKNKVIAAYELGIPRRDICSHLRWGAAKYSTIVKPVLDAYEQRAETA